MILALENFSLDFLGRAVAEEWPSASNCLICLLPTLDHRKSHNQDWMSNEIIERSRWVL